MGAKKYEVLRRFVDGKRQDLRLIKVEGDGKQHSMWEPMETLLLFHLCSMRFLNVTIEKTGNTPMLTFQLTDDGRIFMNGAVQQLTDEYGKGAV